MPTLSGSADQEDREECGGLAKLNSLFQAKLSKSEVREAQDREREKTGTQR